MSLADIALVYLIIGLACSVAVYRDGRAHPKQAAVQALITLPIWPIWAPIALGKPTPPRPFGETHRAESPDLGPSMRVEEALREGVEACAGTALEGLLSADAANRIAEEVKRAAQRLSELDALLGSNAFSRAKADQRIAELTRDAASPRALGTARLHLENIERLEAIREHDRRALEELGDLVHALRAQLVLARFAGSSADGASDIVSEVWARVEGLGAAIDAHTCEEREGVA